MTTNLLALLTLIKCFATNTSIKYPTKSVPIPCPDGMLGCLVYHSKEVPVENPKERWVVEKVTESAKWKVESMDGIDFSAIDLPESFQATTDGRVVGVTKRREVLSSNWGPDDETNTAKTNLSSSTQDALHYATNYAIGNFGAVSFTTSQVAHIATIFTNATVGSIDDRTTTIRYRSEIVSAAIFCMFVCSAFVLSCLLANKKRLFQ